MDVMKLVLTDYMEISKLNTVNLVIITDVLLVKFSPTTVSYVPSPIS